MGKKERDEAEIKFESCINDLDDLGYSIDRDTTCDNHGWEIPLTGIDLKYILLEHRKPIEAFYKQHDEVKDE